jgi:PPM family protein phosphatase
LATVNQQVRPEQLADPGEPGAIGYEQFEYASVTDIGIRRTSNQDSHAALLATDPEQWQHQGHIFLVADGMGAHAVGELASELAANIIPHTYHKHARDGPETALRKAFIEANASIHTRGQQNREFHGMGTTGTALLLRPEGAWIAHVGDSRAYRVRDGQIEQLSFDHSLLWELARRQKADPNGLQGVPANVIIRSLGPEALVQVDIEGPHPLQPGDTFILCSDGLSGQLSDHEIGAVAAALPPAEACRFLVNLANLRGGPDNVTVSMVRVTGVVSPPEPPPPEEEVREPWYRRPMPLLVVGVLFAAVAALLAALRPAEPGEVQLRVYAAFAVAAAGLLAGLVGLAIYYLRERARDSKTPKRAKLSIYRQCACPIARPLLDRMVQAENDLKRWTRAHSWEADWQTSEHHHEQAKRFADQGDLAAAFREYCRAVRPFTEALQRERLRDDTTQPVWEKTQ